MKAEAEQEKPVKMQPKSSPPSSSSLCAASPSNATSNAHGAGGRSMDRSRKMTRGGGGYCVLDDLNARLGRESVSMDSRKGLWRRWNLPLCPLETVAVRSLFQNLTPKSESDVSESIESIIGVMPRQGEGRPFRRSID